MSEGSDYSAGAWEGHSFQAAEQAYNQRQHDPTAGRGSRSQSQGTSTASSNVPKSITTHTTHPLLIQLDVTGSMQGWPGKIVGKFPYLDHEMRTEYLDEGAEVSFAAISDTADSYPFQVRPFSRSTAMKDELSALVLTDGGNGPGSMCEAYGIAALHALHNIHMPDAVIKPVYIVIGDEMPYDLITRDEAAEFAKVKLESSRVSAHSLISKELIKKFAVYLILKPYGNETMAGDRMGSVTQMVYDCWSKLIGPERIALLPDHGRVVDTIFGILAQESGKVDYFRKEIEGRQRPDQVRTVYTALETIHTGKTQHRGGHSTFHKGSGGRDSGSLL